MTPHSLSPPVPLGRREVRKHQTRQELLRAGRRLFSEKGLYESRVEDVTSNAGVAKGTLYSYFSSKEELVLAVVEAGFEDLWQCVLASAEAERGPHVPSATLIQAHLEFFEGNPDLLRVFHQVRGVLKFDREEWRPLRAPLHRHLERLAELVTRCPGADALTSAQRYERAGLLFGALSGVISVRVALSPDLASRLSPAPIAQALGTMIDGIASQDPLWLHRAAPPAERSEVRATITEAGRPDA